MPSTTTAVHLMVLFAASLSLVACSNGGQLTLESGARKVTATGSPYVQVNLGGKASMSGTNGVHGWVTIQAVTSQSLQSTDGTNLIINNRTKAFE